METFGGTRWLKMHAADGEVRYRLCQQLEQPCDTREGHDYFVALSLPCGDCGAAL